MLRISLVYINCIYLAVCTHDRQSASGRPRYINRLKMSLYLGPIRVNFFIFLIFNVNFMSALSTTAEKSDTEEFAP